MAFEEFLMAPGRPLFILAIVYAVAAALEAFFPLRNSTQPKFKRLMVNFGMAGTSSILLRFTLYPLVFLLASFVESRQLGLLPLFGVSGIFLTLLSIVVMDWSLFYWHWMLHKVPFLWRFHHVHHTDLDLDASTALRFHFGELAISTLFRSGQILLFGISPVNLVLFEVLVTVAALSHHCNLRLNQGFERRLGWVIVTPRIHGVHHSIIKSETNSNFGTILTLWDRLHRSFNSPINHRVTIGVPEYRDPSELGLGNCLKMPFFSPRKLPTEGL